MIENAENKGFYSKDFVIYLQFEFNHSYRSSLYDSHFSIGSFFLPTFKHLIASNSRSLSDIFMSLM